MNIFFFFSKITIEIIIYYPNQSYSHILKENYLHFLKYIEIEKKLFKEMKNGKCIIEKFSE